MYFNLWISTRVSPQVPQRNKGTGDPGHACALRVHVAVVLRPSGWWALYYQWFAPPLVLLGTSPEIMMWIRWNVVNICWLNYIWFKPTNLCGCKYSQFPTNPTEYGVDRRDDMVEISTTIQSYQGIILFIALRTQFDLIKKSDTLWLFNIATENGPFIDGLPIKSGDFLLLC